jgi:hypothetical protein
VHDEERRVVERRWIAHLLANPLRSIECGNKPRSRSELASPCWVVFVERPADVVGASTPTPIADRTLTSFDRPHRTRQAMQIELRRPCACRCRF